jgi:hypothetical protein
MLADADVSSPLAGGGCGLSCSLVFVPPELMTIYHQGVVRVWRPRWLVILVAAIWDRRWARLEEEFGEAAPNPTRVHLIAARAVRPRPAAAGHRRARTTTPARITGYVKIGIRILRMTIATSTRRELLVAAGYLDICNS